MTKATTRHGESTSPTRSTRRRHRSRRRRHARRRQKVATAFGATDIVAERGDAAIEAVREMTHGVGVDAALECVGTGESVATALAITRPGSMVGIVGVPHGVDASIADTIVFRNVGLRGGVAPARAYIPELLGDVLEGRINPGRVFDFETDLDGIAEAYKATDERRAIKSLGRIRLPPGPKTSSPRGARLEKSRSRF